MRWKLCETPSETQIEFHHATMQLNHTMREVVGPLSLWNYAMKLCIEGDIYIIPKFDILKTGTVKLSIETGPIDFYWHMQDIVSVGTISTPPSQWAGHSVGWRNCHPPAEMA
jgi:hypothetical protein